MSKDLGLLLLLLAVSSVASVSERQCGNDASRLWLDVVIVIDNSKNMNMNLVYETISGIFDQRLQVGTGYDDPRSTRVGFVTFNYNSTDVADFYKLQSWNDLNSQIQRLKVTPLSNSGSSNMDAGLSSAARMINSTTGFRDNFKKIVIVFTSVHGSYRKTPAKSVAQSLKDMGVSVVTVNTGSSSDVQSYLKTIASVNMNFAMADGNATQEILKAMTTTNCFCTNGWRQYQLPFNNDQNRFGTCVFSPSYPASTRGSAMSQCHTNSTQRDGFDGTAYLVNELTQQKRAFNFDYLYNITGQPVNEFYNGLLSYNTAWYWDQPTNKQLVALDPNSGAPPSRAACVADIKYSDGTNSWTPVNCGTSFRFICEKSACDTDNYCN